MEKYLNEYNIDRKTIIKGLRYAIILSLLISAILILFTIEVEALKKAIISLNPYIFIALLLTLFSSWLMASLSLKLMISTIDHKIALKDCLNIFLASAFVSFVTPFATGGGPFQIYFIHKKGVNIGKASTVVVTQFVLRKIILGLTGGIFLLFFKRFISPGVIAPSLFYTAFGFGLLICLFIIIFSLIPGILDNILNLIFRIKKLKTFVQNNQKAKKLLVKGRQELREFRSSFELLSYNKGKLLLVILCNISYWALYFLLVPLILIGLGLEPYFLQSYIMQTIFFLVIPYMPTPGASGIAEIFFASIFIAFIPRSLIGLLTFAWRFLTFYLILLIGGFLALKEIGRKRGKIHEKIRPDHS